MRHIELAAQPDLLQEPLGKRKRPIEPLDFRNRQVLVRPFNSSHDTLVLPATNPPDAKYQSVILPLEPSFGSPCRPRMHTNSHEFLHSAIRADSWVFVGLQTILLSGDRVGGLLAGDSCLRIASELASYNLHRDGLAGLPIRGVRRNFHIDPPPSFSLVRARGSAHWWSNARNANTTEAGPGDCLAGRAGAVRPLS